MKCIIAPIVPIIYDAHQQRFKNTAFNYHFDVSLNKDAGGMFVCLPQGLHLLRVSLSSLRYPTASVCT